MALPVSIFIEIGRVCSPEVALLILANRIVGRLRLRFQYRPSTLSLGAAAVALEHRLGQEGRGIGLLWVKVRPVLLASPFLGWLGHRQMRLEVLVEEYRIPLRPVTE